MRLLNNTNFNFMKMRRTGYIVSGTLVALSLVSLLLHGGPRFGIDFRGGQFIELRFEDKTNPATEVAVPVEQVRKVLNEMNVPASEVKYFGSPQEVGIQIDVEKQMEPEVLQGIYDRLSQETGLNVQERRIEMVGPKIGRELVGSAFWAIVASMVLILVYIMFRFELRFGVGAVIALMHDVIITLGIFSLFEIEVTVPIIAAVLTIIGYSLNDTIVVYDRIRENLKTIKRKVSGYADLINRSINETLSRTIVTSGTTLVVVVVLYFMGGEILRNLAFALICGIVVGTYSSIFVASPILVEWEERQAGAATTTKKN